MKRIGIILGTLLLLNAWPCYATWTLVTGQKVVGTAASSGTTVSATLTNNPTAGNVVCAFLVLSSANTIKTFQDGAATPNAYTVTAHSPSSTNNATAGSYTLAYYIAGATANKTVTVTYNQTVSGTSQLALAEFNTSTGTATYDKDAAGSGSANVTTPSLNPTNSGSLLCGGATPSTTITAVTGSYTALNTNWSGTGAANAYNLSATGATALDMTLSTGTKTYDSMAMAFYAASSATCTPELAVAGAGICEEDFDPRVIEERKR